MKVIELLSKSHNRQGFNCGNEALNNFIAKIARQHIQKGISRTFVLIETEHPKTILGFFTLSLCEIQAENFPSKWAKKYPSKVPGVKLARLAVALEWQGQGVGQILMVEAMERSLLIADNAGVIGLFVDAKNDRVKTYYERYGFISFEKTPLTMFLPLSTIKEILQ